MWWTTKKDRQIESLMGEKSALEKAIALMQKNQQELLDKLEASHDAYRELAARALNDPRAMVETMMQVFEDVAEQQNLSKEKMEFLSPNMEESGAER